MDSARRASATNGVVGATDRQICRVRRRAEAGFVRAGQVVDPRGETSGATDCCVLRSDARSIGGAFVFKASRPTAAVCP
jgi:hypothetical protein